MKMEAQLIRSFAFILATLFATAALAQQPTPAQQLQALSGKLQDEINQDMQVREALVQLQAENAALRKQIEELKTKIDGPKTDEKK